MADHDDEDVPPLEDMTEMLAKVLAISDHDRLKQNKKSTNAIKNNDADDKKNDIKPTSSLPTRDDVCKKPVKKTSEFAGMRKGFLLGPQTKSKKKQQAMKNDNDIPFIKPKENKSSQLEIPDVQAAMTASQGILNNTEWVTNDLLDAFEKNPTLASQINEPRFSQAINEFQHNPQQAMTKYKDDVEIQNFFKEFYMLLGNHFTSFADQKLQHSNPSNVHQGADLSVHSSTNPNQPTADDESNMQEILSRPEVKEVLADPEIQNLLHLLKHDPDKAQSILHDKNNKSLQPKIHQLVTAGLLSYSGR